MKKLKRLLQKLKGKIFNIYFFIALILLIALHLIEITTVTRANLEEKELNVLVLKKYNILKVIKKKGKITCFLLFGCGFYTLGEFTHKFIFWRDAGTNELDILDNRG